MSVGKPEVVDALARGLSVLEAFDENHSEMTLSEVAARTGLTAATARRILRTLEGLGYVGVDGRRYGLRPRVLALGTAFLRSARIDDALMPELRGLVDRFGDAASVGVLNGGDVLYVAHMSDQRALRPVAGLGAVYPAHATSLGKVLLAYLPSDHLRARLEAGPLRRMTPETLIQPEALAIHLAEVRRRGYATSRDELAYGVTSLAVPVILAGHGAVAAINTSGYSGHVTPEGLIAERLSPLLEAADRLAGTLTRQSHLRRALFIGSGS